MSLDIAYILALIIIRLSLSGIEEVRSARHTAAVESSSDSDSDNYSFTRHLVTVVIC